MALCASWTWSNGKTFPAEDAVVIEAAYLLHLFWGEDEVQKPQTSFLRLESGQFLDFIKMREFREDAPTERSTIRRSVGTAGDRGAVLSRGSCSGAALAVCTERTGPAVATCPAAFCAACIDGDPRSVREMLLHAPELANAIVQPQSQTAGARRPHSHPSFATSHSCEIRC
jgi:hypothetical protein